MSKNFDLNFVRGGGGDIGVRGLSGFLISNCGIAVFSGPAGCGFLVPSDCFGNWLKQDLKRLQSRKLLFET